MTTFADLTRRAGRLVADNSPVLLTAIGVTGVVTTAFFTGKATYEATKLIEISEEIGGVSDDPRQELKENVRLVWKLYIPAMGTGLLTIAAIIFSNRIGTRRAAAVAAAYTISERAFEQYRDKITEKFGANKEQAARDEIAQNQVTNNPPGTILVIGSGQVLCRETHTGRYFLSDMETLKKAQNDTNYQLLRDQTAALSDFYDRVGLPNTDMSDDIGWTSDKQLELKFSAAITEDGRPCICFEYNYVTPTRA